MFRFIRRKRQYPTSRPNQVLSFTTEQLESRQLLTSFAFPLLGTLFISADSRGDAIQVVETAGTLKVLSERHGHAPLASVSSGTVSQIVFRGSEQADRFWNHTAVPADARGRGGADLLVGGSGMDDLHGGDGNDTLEGRGGADYLFGNAGHDILRGGDGEDLIQGADGNDTLDGGRDRDTLHGEAGNDVIYGGPDDARDLANGGPGQDTIDGGPGDDILLGDATFSAPDGSPTDRHNQDAIHGGVGDDIIYGNRGADALFGDAGNDTIWGGDGWDRITGGGGNDTLYGENGQDHLSGGNGDDHLEGGDGNDNLDGGQGNDHLDGGAQNDVLVGGGGDDHLRGGSGYDTYPFDVATPIGHDTIEEQGANAFGYGLSQDTLDFSTSRDGIRINLASTAPQTVHANLSLTLSSSWGLENVVGSLGDDVIRGNDLHNVITGLAGNDILFGGDGDDTYRFDADEPLGIDVLFDQVGIDTLDYGDTESSSLSVHLDQVGQRVNENSQLVLSGVFEIVIGGSRDDTLTGNDEVNILSGGGGNDVLSGRGGDDYLNGGVGNDRLEGGEGNDTFVFAGSDLGDDFVLDRNGENTLDFGALQSLLVLDIGKTEPQRYTFGGPTITLLSQFSISHVVGTHYSDIIVGNSLDNQLEGMSGADILDGRDGNDTLWGGSGNDMLVGGAHNDRLLGGEGRDILLGGDGNDGIFGGADSELDYLYSGYGQDRILYRVGDRVMDQMGVDVRIHMVDGWPAWSDYSVAHVDEAFAALQEEAGTTSVLLEPIETVMGTTVRNGVARRA